jgi:hypothetical protein
VSKITQKLPKMIQVAKNNTKSTKNTITIQKVVNHLAKTAKILNDDKKVTQNNKSVSNNDMIVTKNNKQVYENY